MEESQVEAGMNEGKRYDVSGLVSCKGSDDMSTGRTLQQEYIVEVLVRTTRAWSEDGTVEQRWEVMGSALLESLDELLVMRKSDNQTGSRSQLMSLGLI